MRASWKGRTLWWRSGRRGSRGLRPARGRRPPRPCGRARRCWRGPVFARRRRFIDWAKFRTWRTGSQARVRARRRKAVAPRRPPPPSACAVDLWTSGRPCRWNFARPQLHRASPPPRDPHPPPRIKRTRGEEMTGKIQDSAARARRPPPPSACAVDLWASGRPCRWDFARPPAPRIRRQSREPYARRQGARRPRPSQGPASRPAGRVRRRSRSPPSRSSHPPRSPPRSRPTSPSTPRAGRATPRAPRGAGTAAGCRRRAAGSP